MNAFIFALATAALVPGAACQSGISSTPVIADNAYLTNPVGGLDRTDGDASIVNVSGQPFKQALRVTIRKPATESNWTQMTIPVAAPVKKGDPMVASIWLRGAAKGGQSRGQIVLLFERRESPWTKSVNKDMTTAKGSEQWKKFTVAFQSAETYAPGEAMVSVRFATQPQTVEVGGLSVGILPPGTNLDEFQDQLIGNTPLGKVSVNVDLTKTKQTMMGFGGDFPIARYGSTEAMDVVGQYALDHLRVVHARVGLPLNYWNPSRGEYRDDAQAHATFLILQNMTRRHIPTVLSLWEGPAWLLGEGREQAGRVLDPLKYGDCADAIVKFLATAKDTYGATVDYFSFNEPDYGVNFKFTPQTMIDFIRVAGPRLQQAGLKTKFLVGDTGGGSEFPAYAEPILSDTSISQFLGPISFHCWDGLGASADIYAGIGKLGKQFGKQVWCLEAGWDSGLWQAPDPWARWDNAINTAVVYERTLRITSASLMDYWTYQDNYPLVDKNGPKPYAVFHIVKQMEDVFAPGSRVIATSAGDDDVRVLGTVGPKAGEIGLLIVNQQGPGSVTLSGLPAGKKLNLIVSTKLAQLAGKGLLTVGKDGKVTVTLPSRSVVTLKG